MNQDLYDLFEEFMNGDFADSLVAFRIREQVLALRLSIDTLTHMDNRRVGLTRSQREDLEDHWQDLDAMTRVYIYFSGDNDLSDLPEWNHNSITTTVDGWDYWNQGDIK